ncbi:S1 family peptidase [Flavobacterium sp. UBA7680]|uniref:S1 family peptidase n=1 Tax=Flavobacterium sp. UBA7680 TaxID=1946559 RepID=UPI0025BF880F|nr:serine protease [Flavobacterium sp. UBA7680]
MITNNIIGRTYFISINDDEGSSFTLEHNDIQYLITAKHVIDSLNFKNGDNIEINISYDEKWHKLKCVAYQHHDPGIDIVVLKLEKPTFPQYPISFVMENLYYGGDVFFLGFPYGMFTKDDSKINNKFPLPFVKKGILSAMQREFSITTLYLDAHNNNGFSGGPVITLNQKKEVSIVGVNVSYIKHEKYLNIEESDEDGELFEKQVDYFENSGIMEAQGINHVFEILEQNKL